MSDQNVQNLLRFTAEVTAKLPKTEDDEKFRFMPDTLPPLPEVLETDELIIKRGYHDYGTWRIDYPQVFARKPIYEALGVVTAAVLLQPRRGNTIIRLTNSRSEIRELRIEFLHPDLDIDYLYGLHQVPVVFAYLPQQIQSKPWLRDSVTDPEDYPRVLLTTEDDCPITDEDWSHRDILCGFGSAEGTARMAQLFLDMSRKSNEIPEFLLESEAGFRGVAPASAEIRFWLPGGVFPDDEFP